MSPLRLEEVKKSGTHTAFTFQSGAQYGVTVAYYQLLHDEQRVVCRSCAV